MSTVTNSPSEIQPHKIGVDDALTIATKLLEVYRGKDNGYVGDDEVARSLGLPRAWVREVRVKLYGHVESPGNDEIIRLVKEAQALRNNAVELLRKIDEEIRLMREGKLL